MTDYSTLINLQKENLPISFNKCCSLLNIKPVNITDKSSKNNILKFKLGNIDYKYKEKTKSLYIDITEHTKTILEFSEELPAILKDHFRKKPLEPILCFPISFCQLIEFIQYYSDVAVYNLLGIVNRAETKDWNLTARETETTKKFENICRGWADEWNEIPYDLEPRIKGVRRLIELCNPENPRNIKFLAKDHELESLYKKTYRKLNEEFAYALSYGCEKEESEEIPSYKSKKTNTNTDNLDIEPDWESLRYKQKFQGLFLIDSLEAYWADKQSLPTQYISLKNWILKHKIKDFLVEGNTAYNWITIEHNDYDDESLKRSFKNILSKIHTS